MKTQGVSFVYVNKYVLYNNSCGCRWWGGGASKSTWVPKTKPLGATSPKSGGKYYWLFLSNEPIESMTENNVCAMFEGKSVEIARSLYYV